MLDGEGWDTSDPNGVYQTLTDACSHTSEWWDAGMGALGGLPNNPVQAVAAYAQTAISKRFGRYDPDWFEKENPKSPLIDFGLVKEMKVAMFVGLWDGTCPLTMAKEQYDQMGPDTVSDWIVTPTQGHVPWGFTNSEWFVNTMARVLMTNADQ